jgi:hypothetical protein
MTKTHYTIPDGCTGFTVEQEGSRLIIEFITEPKRWRAEICKNYYTIAHNLVFCLFEDNDKVDDFNYNSGNYFRTEEEAKAELEAELERWKAK